MIKTGIDIVEIKRFSELKNREAFLERVFTQAEGEYLKKKGNLCESMAGMYAAKEAFAKYLGTGVRGFSLREIEVRHDALGQPHLFFRGEAVSAGLSISHSDTTAVAVVCGNDLEQSKVFPIDWKRYQALLPIRSADAHKGICGRVWILAGSLGMTGAAELSARGALRCGSGLVTVGTPASAQPILAGKLTEAMTIPLPEENGLLGVAAMPMILQQAKESDVCVVGPGLGRGPQLWEIISELIELGIPMVLDADGLNAISQHIDVLKKAKGTVVLTPHPGEMSRLCGRSITEIEKNRQEIAVEFAKRWGVTLLLKGKDTVIADPDGNWSINPTGNAGMASGGMGDVLSGVIGSWMGQGLSPYDGAMLGAFLHGLAGDLTAEELGQFGMLAGDVAERLPRGIKALQQGLFV